MRLISFTVQNALSVAHKALTVMPLDHINVIIGKNNCGKSNIIRCIDWMCISGKNFKGTRTGASLPHAFEHQGKTKESQVPVISLVIQLDPFDLAHVNDLLPFKKQTSPFKEEIPPRQSEAAFGTASRSKS